MFEKQKTIKQAATLSGIGLHTGHPVQVTFQPAPQNSGIIFHRMDLPGLNGQAHFPAEISSVMIDTRIPRCTTIGKGETVIHTVEHLMSVLCGLGIDNLNVELNSNELPGLDGSGQGFLSALLCAGLVEQESPKNYFSVQETVGVELGGSSIFIIPAPDFRISYTLDYPHPLLASQFFSAKIDESTFAREIAPCRTFCLEKEAEELKRLGIGKGANYDNTLVVGDEGIMHNHLRFSDEFARHKVLDLIGDLYLLGMPIRGHVYAVKSGHTLNVALLKKIHQQKVKLEHKPYVPSYPPAGQRQFDIAQIMNILPHRYPFLLVDRVIEVERGKKAIGIKNVTINDNFFQGHFPSRPIMPGVLMIEAMAQTAGVTFLTNEQHHGKVAFFMAVDKVKFRRVVVPGDQLFLEVEVIRDRAKTAQIRAIAKVGEEIAAEAEMMFSFTEASYLD